MRTTTQTSLSRQVASNYVEAFKSLLQKIDLDAIERTVEHLRLVRDNGATIYVAGNGGSAATASHWVNDLGKATKLSRCTAIRAMCLSDNVPWLTALANDEGYDRVFAGQLENFAQANDLLVVISASGNSANLVNAVEYAKCRSTLTIGFLGFDGGILKEMVDDYIWLPTENGAYQLVEDAHSLLCHVLTTCLMQNVPSSKNSVKRKIS